TTMVRRGQSHSKRARRRHRLTLKGRDGGVEGEAGRVDRTAEVPARCCIPLQSVACYRVLALLMPIPSRVRGSSPFPSGFRLSRLSLRESVTGGLGGACPFRLWPRVALAGVSGCAIIGDGGKSGFLLFVG